MTRRPAERSTPLLSRSRAYGRGRPRRPGLSLASLLAVLALVLLGTLAPAAAVAPAAAGATPATSGPWSWPLDGPRRVVRGFELPTGPWLPGHRGVDLRASPGDPVRAAGAGTVTFAGWVGGVPAVAVTHPDGLRTTYEPVLAIVIRGEDVTRGAILGRLSVGGSHCLPLACLHWGLRRASTYLDPLRLVGAGIEVRLLPVWSDLVMPTRWPAAAPRSDQRAPSATRGAAPDAASPARSDLARLGALNRARAVAWKRS